MSWAWDDEAMKPLKGRPPPEPRPWWEKWLLLAVAVACLATVPTLKWLLG
jgi:hypothetical protein